MSWTSPLLLLNAAYLVYAVSSLFTDMLRLRVVWMSGTILFMTYGLIAGLWPAVYWNVPVMAVHIWRITGLVRDRQNVDLDDEAEAIRTLVFPTLDRVAFNAMWHCGDEQIVEDLTLIEQGSDVKDLVLILDGEVDVFIDEKLTRRMGHYRLIGEISSLTGEAANASVVANGAVRLRAWDKQLLAACERRYPTVQVAVLRAMGHEVARKLQ